MDHHSPAAVENDAYAFPASFAQQRLWFLHRLEPDSAAYNICVAFRLGGHLNVPALERSFETIVARHETLRTTFALNDGETMQIVTPAAPLSLPVVDLTTLPQLERDAELRRLIAEESQHPFDLEKGPLLRLSLLRTADDDHVLLIGLHHIISDGWSLPVLFRELAELYGANLTEDRADLPDLPIQYADYAIWQRNCFAEGKLAAELGYWKKQLEHIEVLQLPADRPRRGEPSDRGAKRALVLPPSLCDRLRSFCHRENATLFMVLLAGFQAFLHRCSGQGDIAVGTPIAGRTRPEIENLIGFFVNTLVIRTDFGGDPTFRELLARVRRTALNAYDNQDLPFEKLVQEINPDRSLGSTPLFQTMFSLQTASESWQLPGIDVGPLPAFSNLAKFDFSASISQNENSLRVTFSYKADLFDDATIERWLGHFQSLLEAIVDEPDRKLNELSLLNERERKQLLVDWNRTATNYPSERCVHELFEAQVERTPDKTALVFQDREVSYAELNRRANQLAHHLKNAGFRCGDLAGVCLGRGFELIVALLGILKAGGAYVPLDPGYPKERLAFMLQDTAASLVLTDEDAVGSLPAMSGRAICLDRDWKDIAQQPSFSPSSQSTAHDLAYVIYTSGSTGVPKGVEVPHRGIGRLLFGVDYAQLDSAQTLLHLAPISFDAATFEVWGALLHGGTCVLFPGRVPGAAELGAVLKKYRVSTLWLTAALFNTVIDQEPQALSGVKQLLIGGETLSVPHVRKGLELLPNTKIINGYGPTESTTFTCCYPIPRTLGDDVASVPIGRPIANTEVYILDTHLNPVPMGVAGELYIGGDGLARGYLNRPDLTKERFIANPFSSQAGARLYKTGDQARYLVDGNIEFLGRLDDQVKIRGYRIELGEVETVLCQHPAIQKAVVLVQEGDFEGKFLIAYIVSVEHLTAANDDLRSHLRKKLPDYMVPRVFVRLDFLPLTANGKVDKNALRSSNHRERAGAHGYVEPRNPIEWVLAAIWSEVLKLKRVGVFDDFFELGGHSLLAIRLIAQIREECQVDLSVRQLFESPTISGIAAKIACATDKSKKLRDDEQRSRLVEIQRGSIEEPVFIVPGGLGEEPDLLKYIRLARSVGREYSFVGLVARDSKGISSQHASVGDLAAEYLKEIRSLQPHGPYFLLGECIGGIVAYEMACQLRRQNQEVALLALMDSSRPTFCRYLRFRYGKIRSGYRKMYYGLAHNYYAQRIVFHLNKAGQVSWREKLPYLIQKSALGLSLFPKALPKIKREVKSTPAAEENPYSKAEQDRYFRTLRRHRPKPYDRKLTLIVNEELYDRSPSGEWADLVSEIIEVKKAPGTHDTYLHDNAKDTAQIFKQCLDRARERYWRSNSADAG